MSATMLSSWVRCARLADLRQTFLRRPGFVSFISSAQLSTDASRKEQSSTSLIGRDFLTLRDFSPTEIETLLWTAKDLKTQVKTNKAVYQPLVGKSMAAIFQKRSTRTRVSAEVGFGLLGGQTVILSPEDGHLGVNESVKDTARVLSGFVDLVFARVYGHDLLEEMSSVANVPIINGLSDSYHPLQVLADLLTLQEHFGHLKGLTISWVGDGNNIVHSLLMACPKMGINLRVATPRGYECNQQVLSDAKRFSQMSGSELFLTDDPVESVRDADVIVTDTWISMGQEKEKTERLKAFSGYQVTQKLAGYAAAKWVFLHCLPRKAEEVTDDVFYDRERSLVWLEAENRKWTAMAVMLHLLTDHKPSIPKPTFSRTSSK